MKKKEWEEMKNMTPIELRGKLAELEKKLIDLKMKHTIVPLKNPHELNTIRKNIARIKTLLTLHQQQNIGGAKRKTSLRSQSTR